MAAYQKAFITQQPQRARHRRAADAQRAGQLTFARQTARERQASVQNDEAQCLRQLTIDRQAGVLLLPAAKQAQQRRGAGATRCHKQSTLLKLDLNLTATGLKVEARLRVRKKVCGVV